MRGGRARDAQSVGAGGTFLVFLWLYVLFDPRDPKMLSETLRVVLAGDAACGAVS